MSTYNIRPMIPEDIPELVDMIHELAAFHDETGAASIASVTRDTSGPTPWWHTFVAQTDGTLIGYLVLLPKSKVADGERGIDIDHMYVREPHRGTGVGRVFIETAKIHAQANQCTYLTINTTPNNTSAQSAYEACGFARRPNSKSPRFSLQL